MMRPKGNSWSENEDQALVKAWQERCLDACFDVNQRQDMLWEEIFQFFIHNLGGSTVRTVGDAKSRWTLIDWACMKFYASFMEAERMRQSGSNDNRVFENALASFKDKTGKKFDFLHVWDNLKESAKYAAANTVPLPNTPEETTDDQTTLKSDYTSPSIPLSVSHDPPPFQPVGPRRPRLPRRNRSKRAKKAESNQDVMGERLDEYNNNTQLLIQSRLDRERAREARERERLKRLQNQEEQFIMSQNLSIMNPMQQRYWERKQAAIDARYEMQDNQSSHEDHFSDLSSFNQSQHGYPPNN